MHPGAGRAKYLGNKFSVLARRGFQLQHTFLCFLCARRNKNKTYKPSSGKRIKKSTFFYATKKQHTREAYIRSILESIFRTPFKSVRPSWLVNPLSGRRLEIDCFSPGLRLCVECDGRQHSEYVPYFHKNYQAFLDMKQRDIMKSAMIRKRGLKLIRVPYFIPDQDLESYLLSEINKVM